MQIINQLNQLRLSSVKITFHLEILDDLEFFQFFFLWRWNKWCKKSISSKNVSAYWLGEKAGSGFVKILRAWDEQHWMKPQVSEDIIYELTTVKLMYKTDKPSKVCNKDLTKT